MEASTSDALLDTAAAAALLGMAAGTLENWRVRRQGPPYRKLGAAVRYDRAEILEWARERRVA